MMVGRRSFPFGMVYFPGKTRCSTSRGVIHAGQSVNPCPFPKSRLQHANSMPFQMGGGQVSNCKLGEGECGKHEDLRRSQNGILMNEHGNGGNSPRSCFLKVCEWWHDKTEAEMISMMIIIGARHPNHTLFSEMHRNTIPLSGLRSELIPPEHSNTYNLWLICSICI